MQSDLKELPIVTPVLKVKKNWFLGVASLITLLLAWGSFPRAIAADLKICHL
jgi:hypothetical protein